MISVNEQSERSTRGGAHRVLPALSGGTRVALTISLVGQIVDVLEHRGRRQRALPDLYGRKQCAKPQQMLLRNLNSPAARALVTAATLCLGSSAGTRLATFGTSALWVASQRSYLKAHPLGADASDQMQQYLHVSAALSSAFTRSSSESRTLGETFLLRQLALCYLASGTAKLASGPWRKGHAVDWILSTRAYGNSRIRQTGVARFSSVVSTLTIGAECLAPLIAIGARLPRAKRALTVVGIGGHAAAGIALGIPRFFWAFSAPYAIWNVTSPPEIAGGGDDRMRVLHRAATWVLSAHALLTAVANIPFFSLEQPSAFGAVAAPDWRLFAPIPPRRNYSLLVQLRSAQQGRNSGWTQYFPPAWYRECRVGTNPWGRSEQALLAMVGLIRANRDHPLELDEIILRFIPSDLRRNIARIAVVAVDTATGEQDLTYVTALRGESDREVEV